MLHNPTAVDTYVTKLLVFVTQENAIEEHLLHLSYAPVLQTLLVKGVALSQQPLLPRVMKAMITRQLLLSLLC